MRDKWHIKNNKKGYLKTHVAVNVKTKKILAMKVTDEHVRDIKASPGLVKDVLKSDNITPITIGKLFADGAYDSNDVFRYLEDNGILPCIKVRKNVKVRWKKGNFFRILLFLAQRNDLQKWEDGESYGKRWMVQTVFSCIKRMFGEYVYSVKFENMVKEMILKESLNNILLISV
jgi:hypothetical protein